MLALIGWAVLVVIAAIFILFALGMFGTALAFSSGETVVIGVIFSLLGAAFVYAAWVNVPFVVAMKITSG